ncbi:MAG TPA: hypothetical protein VNX28_02600 [Gemmataceae bacterium]|jgi:hypothetical protein|nr:hypothetical protein [Gemmataceae bacterium]
MKRKRKQKRPQLRTISLWNYPRAHKALPYLRSVTQSLRDHWLEVQGKRLAVARLSRQHGRPDRAALLAGASAAAQKAQAEDRFADALNELVDIDVYLLDPVRGLAFIPFQKEQELAWFVFDLFESDDLKTWRFHKDPLDMRRPIAEVLGDAPIDPAAV